MIEEQTLTPITPEALLPRVKEMHDSGYRLVHICATTLKENFELTYSFDLEGRLINLRMQLPFGAPALPSITDLYWAAFIYENELNDLFGIKIHGNAVDFKGNLYQMAVKYPFGSPTPPTTNPTAAPTSTISTTQIEVIKRPAEPAKAAESPAAQPSASAST